MTKFGKETRHQYVFIKKQHLVNSAKCQTKAHITRSLHFHRHDVLIVPLTVLLQCPITSMTRTLSYKCSNRAGDNQSRSKFLLQFWLILIKEAQFFIGSWRKGPQRGNISLDSTQFPQLMSMAKNTLLKWRFCFFVFVLVDKQHTPQKRRRSCVLLPEWRRKVLVELKMHLFSNIDPCSTMHDHLTSVDSLIMIIHEMNQFCVNFVSKCQDRLRTVLSFHRIKVLASQRKLVRKKYWC